MLADYLKKASEPFGYINLAEAVLWWAIALVVLKMAMGAKRAALTFWMRVLSGTLFVFGASDVIEVGTGAWYRPVGLLALKSVCVLVSLVCLLRLWQLRKA